jgi:signal transduction histidine kinase
VFLSACHRSPPLPRSVTYTPHWYTGQPLLILAGFLVLAAIGATSGWLVFKSQQDAAAVAESVQVQYDLTTQQARIRRIESFQRGYVLTGEPRMLQEYEEAAALVPPATQRLRDVLAEDPGQLARFDVLVPIIDQKLAELAETVALAAAGDAAGALATVRSGRGESLMEQIAAGFEEMREVERRDFAERSRSARLSSIALVAVTIAGILVILTVAAFALFVVGRASRQLAEAHAALATANTDLEARVAERTADLSEANLEIQRFAYIVSHDLRAPLVNIMGFTSELEALRDDVFLRLEALRAKADEEPGADTELAADFTEALGFIKSSIDKMDRLINAILRLSREGRREFRPEVIDAKALADGIGASFAHRLQEIEATLSIGTLPSIETDRLALEQVFTNLIDNAIKYRRDEEPVRIEMSGRFDGRNVIYEVSDNGRGIDKRDLERVFELFRRAGVQNRPGEGIGLAHVKTLVRRLGGAITLRSELDKGTTFTVRLPRRWLPPTQERLQEEPG